ncbi:MAG: HAD family hydrolase [Chloroflexi bacterium]|nr:HAD family hydrolase [Chloroflexota bacterium]
MPLDLTRIQALCFDVDGTLNDTDDQFAEQAEPYFKAIRWLLPARDYKRAARRFVMWAEAPGNALIGLPDSLGIDDELAKIVNWVSQKRKSRIKHFRPIVGVIEMLAAFGEKYPMAVVSARDENSTRIFLRQAGIEQHFVCLAGALTCAHTKPYPDPILWAAAQMGVKAENCLMIGDTTVDMIAGKAAGAQTVGVLCGFGERNELLRKGADLILESTPELTGILLKK